MQGQSPLSPLAEQLHQDAIAQVDRMQPQLANAIATVDSLAPTIGRMVAQVETLQAAGFFDRLPALLDAAQQVIATMPTLPFPLAQEFTHE